MRLSKIFHIIFTLTAFSILFIYFFHPIPLDTGNSDLGRHLLLGKIIFTTGYVPRINLLSYTYPNYPFINTHWLSEVIFYLCYKVIGFNGLIFASIFLMVLAFSSIFIVAAKKFGLFAASIVALFYIQIISERTQIRPELFSFLLLSIFIVVLYKYKDRYTNWIFALLPLELLWVNSHIYFFVGIIVLTLFLIDAVIAKKEKLNSKKTLTLIMVTISTGLIALCNPNFIKGATYPLVVLSNYGLNVQENSNFISAISLYKDPTLFYFGISIIALWAFIFLSMRRLAPIDIMLAVFFTFMGFFAVRNFPLFAFGTFIVCTKTFSMAIEHISGKFRGYSLLGFQVISFILACLFLIPIFKSNIENNKFGLGIIDNSNDAVKFLTKNNIKGTIYNNFDSGNYIIYSLYPKQKVYVDARPEAYPKEFFQKIYFPMREKQSLFKKEDNKYSFNVIFFNHTDLAYDTEQFLHQLIQKNNWKMVYLNNSIVIFLKNTPANHSIISKYFISEENVHIFNEDLNSRDKVMHLANFFGAVGWESQQADMTIQYLNYNPTDCNAIKNVIILLKKHQNSKTEDYVNKYIRTCR